MPSVLAASGMVALTALSGGSPTQIACRFGVHPTQVSTWKKRHDEGTEALFADKYRMKLNAPTKRDLHEQIGRLQMGLAWLKQIRPRRVMSGAVSTGAGTTATSSVAPRAPSFADRVGSYREARQRWIAAGCPVRSREEMAKLHTICTKCEHFTGYSCRVCGCGLHHSRGSWNKLRWATEHCPLATPKW